MQVHRDWLIGAAGPPRTVEALHRVCSVRHALLYSLELDPAGWFDLGDATLPGARVVAADVGVHSSHTTPLPRQRARPPHCPAQVPALPQDRPWCQENTGEHLYQVEARTEVPC